MAPKALHIRMAKAMAMRVAQCFTDRSFPGELAQVPEWGAARLSAFYRRRCDDGMGLLRRDVILDAAP